MEKEELKENETKIIVKNSNKSNIIRTLVLIIIILILAFTLYIVVSKRTNFKTQEKSTKLGLENVGELVTQTCYVTVLEDSKVNRDFFKLFDIPFTESRQIFSYDFEVDAAVNFDQIKIVNVNDETKELELILPHAKIYKIALNPSSFRVYLDNESLFSRIDLEKHNLAITKMQEQAQTDCIKNNVLGAADENAKKLMTGLIQGNVYYKDYKINYIYEGE